MRNSDLITELGICVVSWFRRSTKVWRIIAILLFLLIANSISYLTYNAYVIIYLISSEKYASLNVALEQGSPYCSLRDQRFDKLPFKEWNMAGKSEYKGYLRNMKIVFTKFGVLSVCAVFSREKEKEYVDRFCNLAPWELDSIELIQAEKNPQPSIVKK